MCTNHSPPLESPRPLSYSLAQDGTWSSTAQLVLWSHILMRHVHTNHWICSSPANLFYIHLITRSAKEPTRVEEVCFPPQQQLSWSWFWFSVINKGFYFHLRNFHKSLSWHLKLWIFTLCHTISDCFSVGLETKSCMERMLSVASLYVVFISVETYIWTYLYYLIKCIFLLHHLSLVIISAFAIPNDKLSWPVLPKCRLFCPRKIFANIWRHSCLSQLHMRKCYCYLVVGGHGLLLNILQCIRCPS